MSPHPPYRSPGQRESRCFPPLPVPQEMHRGDRGSRVFKTKQYWNVPAGWVAWADDAASSTGKTGTEGQSQGAVLRKKSSVICRVTGSVSSIQ